MNIKTLSLTILAMGSALGTPTDIAVVAPSDWGNVKMRRSGSNFKLLINDQENKVEDYMIDPMLRKMTPEQTAAFLKNGYLSAKKLSDGSYKLEAKGRIKGGGPATAAALYWVTKIGCYGTAAAATGTIAVATAGTGLAAVGGAGATLAGGIVASGAGVGAPIAGLVAGGIANAAAAEAAIATAAVVSSTGSIAGAVALVESAATAAFALGMMLPLP